MDQVRLELKVPAKWPLNLTTSNGHIKTLHSRSSVIATTSNGAIDIVDAQGDIRPTTSNGRIEIQQSSGNVQAQTSNGAVKLIECDLQGDNKLSTSNGAIEVQLNATSKVKITGRTSNGSIRGEDQQFEVASKSKSRIEGTWNGKSSDKSAKVASLELSTSNGSVTIKGTAAGEEVSKPTTQDETPAATSSL
jgi:DUF4097 and DUF4098 domain-containing protein YvlB